MSHNPTMRFESFIFNNLDRVLKLETLDTLGNRMKYIGSSDLSDCPYKVVQSKLNPPKYSIKQQIIFQRGHLAESIVAKMLSGLKNVREQVEVTAEMGTLPLKAHIDFLVKDKKKCVIIEAKTVSAPIDVPYESWVMQVQYQMGLLMQEGCNSNEIEAYVLALDLNTGWLKSFKVEFSDALFEISLGKAEHIEESLLGKCEPKAVIQNYCGTCPYKMECPKQGKFSEELPLDLKADLEFIKKSKVMAKESKLREANVKKYLVEMGIESGKDENASTVVSIKKQTTTRVNLEQLKLVYPEIYKELSYESNLHRMTVI